MIKEFKEGLKEGLKDFDWRILGEMSGIGLAFVVILLIFLFVMGVFLFIIQKLGIV